MKLYLAVTADEIELIKDFDVSPAALARRLEIPINSLFKAVTRGSSGVRVGVKIIKIEIDDED